MRLFSLTEVSAADDDDDDVPNPNRKSMIKFMTDDELDDMGKGNFTRQDTPHPKELKERHKRLLAKQKVGHLIFGRCRVLGTCDIYVCVCSMYIICRQLLCVRLLLLFTDSLLYVYTHAPHQRN